MQKLHILLAEDHTEVFRCGAAGYMLKSSSAGELEEAILEGAKERVCVSRRLRDNQGGRERSMEAEERKLLKRLVESCEGIEMLLAMWIERSVPAGEIWVEEGPEPSTSKRPWRVPVE